MEKKQTTERLLPYSCCGCPPVRRDEIKPPKTAAKIDEMRLPSDLVELAKEGLGY